MAFRDLFLSFENRIGRSAYWLGTLGLVLISLPWAGFYISASGSALAESIPGVLDFGDLLVSMALSIPASALAVKRARDCGWPLWLGYVSGALLVGAALMFFLFGSALQAVEWSYGDAIGLLMLLVSATVALALGVVPSRGVAPERGPVAA